MLPVKAEPETDGIFTSGVPSTLDDQLRSIAVTFFRLSQMNGGGRGEGEKGRELENNQA